MVEKKTMKFTEKGGWIMGKLARPRSWYEKMVEVPASERTTITLQKNIVLSSVFTESKIQTDGVCKGDYNNQFTVTVERGNAKETFTFGISIVDTRKGKVTLTDQDHIFAFYCFVGDAISGSMTFKDFKSEYGYEDCCEAHKIWKLCQDSTMKAIRLNLGDLYELSNAIQEKYPEVI